MHKCAKCGTRGERLSEAISSKGVIKLCDDCCIILRVPLIKKSPTILERNYFRKQVSEPVNSGVSDFVKNFHWEIMRARRARKMSQSQLAREILESEGVLRRIESGNASRDDFKAVGKLEDFFGINLFSENGKVQKSERNVRKSYVDDLISELGSQNLENKKFKDFRVKEESKKCNVLSKVPEVDLLPVKDEEGAVAQRAKKIIESFGETENSFENNNEKAKVKEKILFEREEKESFSKKIKPAFIRLDKFNESLNSVEVVEEEIDKISNFFGDLERLKEEEEKKLDLWEKKMCSLKENFEEIDKNFFRFD
ncbi:MAG: helix-turn-helix domain-containing protein [Candidatus Pacearchaeota archaeon]|nr:helix-turn-helix domain-containing protein [Candidatus Pacearchaeota archaeon]